MGGDDFVPEGVDTVPFKPRKHYGPVLELTRHVSTDRQKNIYSQCGLVQDRNYGTFVTTICGWEMSSLLIPVQ